MVARLPKSLRCYVDDDADTASWWGGGDNVPKQGCEMIAFPEPVRSDANDIDLQMQLRSGRRRSSEGVI